jgi:hypothetical protein
VLTLNTFLIGVFGVPMQWLPGTGGSRILFGEWYMYHAVSSSDRFEFLNPIDAFRVSYESKGF